MSYSENNTFEKIMTRMLANPVLSDVDRRVGSVIYDSLAPCALELSEAYIKMDVLEAQTNILTATGTNLDKKAYDYGISRTEATYAQRVAEFYKYKTNSNGDYIKDSEGNRILEAMDIPEDSRFTVPSNSSLIYKYIGEIDGNKIVQCETTGTIGNEHLGTILPLNPIGGLVKASIVSTYKPAEDKETDDALRKRIEDSLNYASFGGNIQDYIEKVNAIDGVGMTKVFPAWRHNGSVLLSIVDPTYEPITDEFAHNLKEQIDPESNTGEGIGIAPIGHYVTITTPVKESVDVKMTVAITNNRTLETIYEDIQEKLEEYFTSLRHSFQQDVNITVYRARIIEKVLEISDVMNVTDVALNGSFIDLVFIDEGDVGTQYLPYLGELTIE